MKEIILGIYAPAVGTWMDVRIAGDVTMADAIPVLAAMMEKTTHHQFLAHDHNLLIRLNDQNCMPKTKTIEELHITSGEIFYLL